MQMSQMFCELPFRGGRDVLHKQNSRLSVSPLKALRMFQVFNPVLRGSLYNTLGKPVLRITQGRP